MSNDPNKDGQKPLSELPPYERIMQERAMAKKAEAEKAAKEAEENARAKQTAAQTRAAEDAPDEWATRQIPAQRTSRAEKEARPSSLAEAAARRAAARRQAEKAAIEKRKMAEKAKVEKSDEEMGGKAVNEVATDVSEDVHPDAAAASASGAVAADAATKARETEAQDASFEAVDNERASAVNTGTQRQSAQSNRHAKKVETQPTHRESAASSHSRRHKRRRHVPWVAIVLLLCVGVVAAACTLLGVNWIMPANANSNEVIEFEVPSGTPVSTMGDMLEEEGVIRSSNAFSLYVRLVGAAANLQAGVHDLSPSMTMGEIVSSLQEGAQELGLTKVTVNEGLTVDQIAEVVGESTGYSAEEFLALMTDQTFLSELVGEYPILTDSYNNPNVRYVLEGYLFPATYDFDEEEGLESLVRQMVEKTNDILAEHQADIDASSYSVQDIMSIASLVEREGLTTEDRKLIAGVFYNRLEQGMPIQSDISVLYALGTHKEMVTYDDLQVDSPYNLYLNAGLPPGPIGNPSEDAILAALEPTDNNYLYFYANIDTGEVYYTDDYEQHLAWQEEYESTGDIAG